MNTYFLNRENELKAGREWPHRSKYIVICNNDPFYSSMLTNDKEAIPLLMKKVEEKVVKLSNERLETEQTCGS